MFATRRLILLTTASVIFAVSSSASAAVDDPLWQKAVALAARNQDREAGRITAQPLPLVNFEGTVRSSCVFADYRRSTGR